MFYHLDGIKVWAGQQLHQDAILASPALNLTAFIPSVQPHSAECLLTRAAEVSENGDLLILGGLAHERVSVRLIWISF